jgi:restriction endonuclease S subunit
LAVKENKIVRAAAPAVLSEEWRVVRFDEMAQLVNDRIDDPSKAGVERYVGLEHLDPESLKLRRWGSPNDVEAQKLRFQPGDIIFGKRRAYQRKLAVADFEGICSAHAMVLRAREETVVKEFLPFFMQSDTFFERALSISVGLLSPTINWKTLASQQFAIPPKNEQHRIAEILGAADELSEQLSKP